MGKSRRKFEVEFTRRLVEKPAAGAPAPGRSHREEGAYRNDHHRSSHQMWGIDATATVTLDNGQVTVFAAVDPLYGRMRRYSCRETRDVL